MMNDTRMYTLITTSEDARWAITDALVCLQALANDDASAADLASVVYDLLEVIDPEGLL